MFELLPDWIKSLIGTILMLFIGVVGLNLTSKNISKKDKNISNSSEKKGS